MSCAGAEGAPRALDMLREVAARGEPFDLALLDLMMPDMDGLQLAQAIKADPAIAATPLVLLTSFGRRGQAAEAQQAGIAAYLTKPVRQGALHDCLATVLGAIRPSPPPSPSPVIHCNQGATGSPGEGQFIPSPLEGEGQGEGAPASPPLITRHTLAEARSQARPRILVTDDNLVNRKIAVRMLEGLGYQADTAENGRQALEALARLPYDLVLMDCQMPVMDGYEATRKIREIENTVGARHAVPLPGLPSPHIPIIAVTAGAMAGDRERCLAAGMDDYIAKPVKKETLDAALKRWLAPVHEETPVGAQFIAPSSPSTVPIVPPQAGVMNHAPTNRPVIEQPALNLAVLAELRALQGEGPEDLLTMLVEYFLRDTPSRLASMRTAAAQKDARALERVAHTMKSSCASLGAVPMAELCAQLERCGRNNRLEDAVPSLDRLDGEFDRVARALPEVLAQCT
jgi:CheY-like chemotaxis protein/HPt (histidine-containing phosphotransfer) domain-containing protein